MKPLSITVITDTHYYSKKNWVDGDPYKFPPKRDQLYRRGSEEIIKHVFDEISGENEPDIVLLGGDLTNNGELTSHEEIRELMRSLKARGKRVYAITATHDYRNEGTSYGWNDKNEEVRVPALKNREDLKDYYFEFGMNEALSIHMPSMCYSVNLTDEYRLLALNSDHGKVKAGYSDDCWKWIENQVAEAKEAGQVIVAIAHHPIIPPSPLYEIIGVQDVQEGSRETAKRFADLGVFCMFTGHSHIHNISSVTTEKGNIFYDISTSALTGFPPYYRHVTFDPDNRNISVKSVLVDNVPGLDTQGLSLSDFCEKQFLGLVTDILDTAENDYEAFLPLANGFSLKKDKAMKLKPVIQPMAKYLNHMTFGRLWRFTKLHNNVTLKEIKPIKDKKVVPFAMKGAENLYRGDADLDVNSAEYRTFAGFLKWLEIMTKPFKGKLKSLGIDSITGLILPLLHKEGLPDADAELKY